MKLMLAVVASALLFPLKVAGEEPKHAWVVGTRYESAIQLEVFARLEAGESGYYELSAIKEGASGRSVNRQAGSVPESEGEVLGPISISRFSVETGATLIVELVVTSKSGSVYRDTVQFKGE
ncbi:curli-like amyloid fiber formation chaperone CsgH [Thalassovita sp.]|uniref:curli-like amyloid fiber formation chaperone CsgH n=1 Tax=Thalassovita sp. TaxID=1979401 RepID=UPI002B26D89B|nr:curli-like amyloid fiber formation chaperone CsgH [Thalassovita sp.]